MGVFSKLNEHIKSNKPGTEEYKKKQEEIETKRKKREEEERIETDKMLKMSTGEQWEYIRQKPQVILMIVAAVVAIALIVLKIVLKF